MKTPRNIFDNLPSLAPLRTTAVIDELALYLGTELENITDPVQWWHEKKATYPRLSRMALDYLSIPGTFILSLFIILSLFLRVSQRPPSMLSASSVAADLSFHILGVGYQLHQRAPYCVLDPGVWRVW